MEEKPIFKPLSGWTTVDISCVPVYSKHLYEFLASHVLTVIQDEVEYNDRKYWIRRVSNSDALGKAVMMRDKFDYSSSVIMARNEEKAYPQ